MGMAVRDLDVDLVVLIYFGFNLNGVQGFVLLSKIAVSDNQTRMGRRQWHFRSAFGAYLHRKCRSAEQPHQRQPGGEVNGRLQGANRDIALICDLLSHIDPRQQDMPCDDAEEGLDGEQDQGHPGP